MSDITIVPAQETENEESIFSKSYFDLKKLCDNDEYLGTLNSKQLKALINKSKGIQSEYKNFELVVKRDANSLYGTAASIYFSMSNFDVAEDITMTGKHYAVIVDIGINEFFRDWSSKELDVVKKFYPNCTGLKQFTQYKKDTPNDLCVYGDTDSRYIDLFMIYQLLEGVEFPPNTTEGNIELGDFAIFLMDEFINDLIKQIINDDLEFRGGKKGYLKMAHEVTTRKTIFQARKKYVMAKIWADGKHMKEPSLKIVGVELKKGELNSRIKKVIRELINDFMLKDESIEKLRATSIKLMAYIKQRSEKNFICKVTAVRSLDDIYLDNNLDRYTSTKNHIQMKIALSWYNYIRDNGLEQEYKFPFEGQKMYYYYYMDLTTGIRKVQGIPDDVPIDKIKGLPAPDFNHMLKQILIKSLLRYIYSDDNKDKITDNHIEHFLVGLIKII